jgi:hypothetical protein
VPEWLAQLEVCVSRKWLYIRSRTYVRKFKEEPSLNPNFNMQHCPSTATVIAQQYSSTIFASLRFYYRQEKFSQRF